MNSQVVVVHFGGIRPFAAHDLRKLPQLVHVSVGLDAKVNGVPSRGKSACRLRKRQVERQPLAVEALYRTEVDRPLRAVNPQTAMRQTARNAAA